MDCSVATLDLKAIERFWSTIILNVDVDEPGDMAVSNS